MIADRLQVVYAALDVAQRGVGVARIALLLNGDVAAVAKTIRDFSKEKGNDALVIKAAILDGKILTKDQIFVLADLPSKDVLIAQVVRTIAAPLQGLVTVLSGPARGLVTCLSQIKDKKDAA